MIRAALIGLVFSAAAVSAQEVADCDWVANAQNIMEPWDENTRTFSNEKVRVAAIDTVEPAAAAFHLLILSPPYDEVGGRQCRVISRATNIGFTALYFQEMQASYDPSKGLMITVPVGLDPDKIGLSEAQLLTLTLNQSTGEIVTSIGPLTK